MTHEMPLNDGWEFTRSPDAGFFTGEGGETELVRLPHTGTELPYNYTDETEYQYLSAYRKKLVLPPLRGGRRLFVRFDGAAHRARLCLNGVTLLHHACGYTAFTAELTNSLQEGENWLAVELDSREELDQPPFGNEIDYLTYQGLYRGCTLIVTGPSFISDAFVHTREETLFLELLTVGFAAAAVLRVEDQSGQEVAAGRFPLLDAASTVLPVPAGLPVPAAQLRGSSLRLSCSGVRRWSPETPQLYSLVITLENDGGKVLEEKRVRFGFREAEFRREGFFLNGRKLRLRGLDRHQAYPYLGYAMPDGVQRQDAEILRRELGLNVVRTSHYPQSQAFLDRCDELGLLVFTEIPGWQHIGGSRWQEQALRNVDDMVSQARNHPCVILWGVRINESADCDPLYERTNALSHALDPTRQTGGVRCIPGSHLLEDVYTFNDFVHDGQAPGLRPRGMITAEQRKPYLVTEYNGHMYPTKAGDAAPHRQEHALRHARVLDAMYGMEDLAGCIGWCAFDYNTHLNFGSGDRICYHGVMDMFRNPKPAAAVYASQAEEAPVLELSAPLEKGDWPASVPEPLWAFTNGDSLRLYRDGVLLRELLPDRVQFPHLPHPPIRLDDFSGPELAAEPGVGEEAAILLRQVWAGQDREAALRLLRRRFGIKQEQVEALRLRFAFPLPGAIYDLEALREGKPLLRRSIAPIRKLGLELDAARTVLHEAGSWDGVLVRIRAVDQNGNRLWYAADPLVLETEGPLQVIGPRCIPLRGGSAGVYLRTTGATGPGTLTVSGLGEAKTLHFTVE